MPLIYTSADCSDVRVTTPSLPASPFPLPGTVSSGVRPHDSDGRQAIRPCLLAVGDRDPLPLSSRMAPPLRARQPLNSASLDIAPSPALVTPTLPPLGF